MEIQNNENSDFANNVFKNMNELFFNPEITKRKEQHLLPDDFTLVAGASNIISRWQATYC